MKVSLYQYRGKRILHTLQKMLSASVFCFLCACSTSPDDDVKVFVAQTKQKKSSGVEPLPLYHKFEPFKYTAAQYKDPFETPNTAKAKTPAVARRGGPSPDLTRPRELLESYSIDSLKMVGTLQRGGTFWALIRDPQGIVHRVSIGNYLGENYGKIERVSERSIDIRELISDEQGGYQERVITMRLAD